MESEKGGTDMSYSAHITEPGTIRYPMHRHDEWEIMYYTEGQGYMLTEKGKIPFEKCDAILVPPGILHGSVSENGFVNISVVGDFSHLFMFDTPVRVSDMGRQDGQMLSTLIFDNRYGRKEYLSALCTAYAKYLLQNMQCDSPLGAAVTEVVRIIDKEYTDSNFCVTDLLKSSGFAEDYLRAAFKKQTGLTPIGFLHKVRIEHAKTLLDIYGKSRSITDIAAACGYDDVVYFSKRFKEYVGISPDSYRNRKTG